MRMLEKRDAMRIFYYFMALDEIVGDELQKYDEIGMEIDSSFHEYKDIIITECEDMLSQITEERIELIQEKIDSILYKGITRNEDSISISMLIWDLLVIANADSEYTEDEKKMIQHIARVGELDKNTFLEMEQMIKTAVCIAHELDYLQNSNKTYGEIRPLVDELEKRQKNLVTAVREIISDDYERDEQYVSEDKKTILGENFERAKEKIAPVSGEIGKGTKKVVEQMGKGASVAVSSVRDGAGILFNKLKSHKSNDISKTEEQ